MAKKPARRRLDAELVKRKIARSRDQAVEMIRGGRVVVNGLIAVKPATMVASEASIKVDKNLDDDWASRGAHKLLGALDAFEPQGLSIKARKILDAGASTGGFTDVCLKRGACEVVAVDVGYGQLLWRLQDDTRVRVLDRTNVRNLTPQLTNGLCDVMVGDLSFISLKLVLPAVVACMDAGADLLPMVKPQFEVGKDRLGQGGVVRSAQLRIETTTEIAHYAQGLGLSLRGVVASPLPGPSGNVEYFLWLINDGGAQSVELSKLESMVTAAVQEGPQ
ncbi:TlyA family RNA methyltransferase [Corynebacterium kroppenstedtii]|uniref:TlyA family RNA methyltransferase n=1 Tax=Corynebacterium sp. PCR 32 TaxID=3351342 RepID=UPI0030A380E4